MSKNVSIDPELVMRILYGAPSGQRFTQDTPILPEVWLTLAENPGKNVRTLIVPRSGNQAHHVANELYYRIIEYRKQAGIEKREASNISDIPSVVAADLYLEELVNVILPITSWWESHHLKQLLLDKSQTELTKELMNVFKSLIKIEDNERNPQFIPPPLNMKLPQDKSEEKPRKRSSKKTKCVHDSTVRLIVLLAVFVCAIKGKCKAESDDEDSDDKNIIIKKLKQIEPKDAANAVKSLFLKKFLEQSDKPHTPAKIKKDNSNIEDQQLVFTVSLNRRTETSVWDSVPTTKADAARRLFNISSRRIAWAVIDSGIDATHYAFKKIKPDERANTISDDDREDAIDDEKKSRIVKKFDMTQVHNLRNRDIMLVPKERSILAKEIEKYTSGLSLAEIEERLEQLGANIDSGRQIDWDIVEELVTVKFDQIPESDHGTHVSGILGGSWTEEDSNKKIEWVEGMCPDITIYDFKVIAPTMHATEFAVIAALRLIRHVNERNDFILIHGANLSLSIKHDVTNYACGRTPVCEESERLVESGVVVVAAAGNDGYNDFLTKKGIKSLHTGTSITDPGNAESVITVGSTHRREPHNYGVSYFSSRGPTGDGRMKPDIVAPGEKIDAPIRNGEFATLEGTSMAAPHVSGAAAMLMARFPELIGQPHRIKQILCSTATDLGRERFYQGNGLVDVLRALQSV